MLKCNLCINKLIHAKISKNENLSIEPFYPRVANCQGCYRHKSQITNSKSYLMGSKNYMAGTTQNQQVPYFHCDPPENLKW